MKNFSERGFSHIIVIAVVVVIAVIGVGGWLVFKNDNPPANANTEAVRKALKNVKCDIDDKDLCKFFASWKASRYFTASTTTTVARTTNTSVLEVDGRNYRSKINAELVQETIVIGNSLYAKDTEKNKWYKQELTKPSTTGFQFDESELFKDGGGKFTYKNLGKEACGERTCFKYQVTNQEDRTTKQYIWFDDKDYQLWKQTTEQNEGKFNTSTTFTYEKVTISEPSPFTELRGGQMYIPGQGVFDPSTQGL